MMSREFSSRKTRYSYNGYTDMLARQRNETIIVPERDNTKPRKFTCQIISMASTILTWYNYWGQVISTEKDINVGDIALYKTV